MQNIYADSFITLLNCAKIKAHYYSLIDSTHFYDVPFVELEELKIEDVIKRMGLYPIPFFSLEVAKRSTDHRTSKCIKSLWQGMYFTHHLHDVHHTLTATAKVPVSQSLDNQLVLTEAHWDILKAKSRSDISVFHQIPDSINIVENQLNTPPRDETLNSIEIPIGELLYSKFPHKVVAELTGLTPYWVKNVRKQNISENEFIPNTFVQKRSLERNCIHRFTLFLADRFFNLQLRLGMSPVQAFYKTVNIVSCAPTFIANKSDDFHLVTNLYYWLSLRGQLPAQQFTHPVQASHFPDSFLAYFENGSKATLPYIRKMGVFPISPSLDSEHQKLLKAINKAITNGTCLKTVVQNYYRGVYA